MKLARSCMISEIDKYSQRELGITVKTLMGRAGHTVAEAVRARTAVGGSVIVLCGKGNNGGDGYAAAAELLSDYRVLAFDVLSSGQKSEEGQYFLEKYKSIGGRVENLTLSDSDRSEIERADCIVDAVFGSGFRGECPEIVAKLGEIICATVSAVKIAIDVPMGVGADDGSIKLSSVPAVDATVALSFIKPGLVSYPARSYIGELIYDDLGLPIERISNEFEFNHFYLDQKLAKELLPTRPANSNKGSFGKLLMITGSSKYRGAAHLSLEAALRSGVGLVSFAGERELVGELAMKLPEAIYRTIPETKSMSDEDISELTELSRAHSATLVGSGSVTSEGLYRLVCSLLCSEGGPLILDADALNSLVLHREEGVVALREAKRRVIITPHPLEFARLSDNDVSFVQLHRMELATRFAKENGVVLVLKGAGTVTTDGDSVYVNSTGSSALAKAGSGDVLAGIVAALCASGTDAIKASALAAYIHGAASDNLALSLSEFGVIPSDLPLSVARVFSELSK